MNSTLGKLLKQKKQILSKYGSYSSRYNRIKSKIWAVKHRKKFLTRMEQYRIDNPEYASFRVLKHKYLKKEKNKAKGYRKLSKYISKDRRRFKFLKKV